MQAFLTIESGTGEPKELSLSSENKATLGRHRNNTIVLQDDHASRWHAEIFREGSRWVIRDFGTLNGTRVNGERVTQQAVLEHGHVITIGTTTLRLTLAHPGEDPVSCGAHG